MRFVPVALCFFLLCLQLTFIHPAAAEELIVPGSGNPEFLLGKLAEAFNASQSEHTVIVPASIGTSGAIREINAGTATLARVGRPLKNSERETGIHYIPLA